MTMNVSIQINRDNIATTMETLLWKYGSAIEGAENFKQVYNTQSDRTNNTLDARIVNDSWETRTQEAIDLLRDFSPTVTSGTGTKTIAMTMSNRWLGSEETLKAALERYIVDGMMCDWLNATAPNEAPQYSSRIPNDEKKIKDNIYSLGKPTL